LRVSMMAGFNKDGETTSNLNGGELFFRYEFCFSKGLKKFVAR